MKAHRTTMGGQRTNAILDWGMLSWKGQWLRQPRGVSSVETLDINMP
jgi:hypothetical protein